VTTPVTAVVLSYEGRDLLDTALPSLLAQTYPDLHVLVVDNGSTDGTEAHVRERWPQVEVLRLPENAGVAGALNRGVDAVRTPLVALLNNDIELEPDWLALLVEDLLAHPDAASSSGKLMRFTEREVFDAAGDGMRWSGAVFNRGAGERDEGQYDRPEEIFGACAGAALYRMSAFADVGGFDERFYAYLEDVDWSLRAQLKGHAARYAPAAVAYHMRGATTGRAKPRYRVPQRRNHVWVLLKSYPLGALVRHAPGIAFLHLGLAVQDAGEGLLGATLRGWGQAVLGVPRVLRQRRRIQRSRRAGPERLTRVMTPEPWTQGSVSERIRATAAAAAPALRRPRG
jgi:GT2 family glycosyltransferase